MSVSYAHRQFALILTSSENLSSLQTNYNLGIKKAGNVLIYRNFIV